MTTLRTSSAHALKQRTKQSARTAQHTRQRNGRQHNSSSPLSLIPGSKNFETQKPLTQRSLQRISSHTYKRGSRAGTPWTSWRCKTKYSAIISRSRESPSILICSRTPRGKSAERGKQSRTKPYSFSPPPP